MDPRPGELPPDRRRCSGREVETRPETVVDEATRAAAAKVRQDGAFIFLLPISLFQSLCDGGYWTLENIMGLCRPPTCPLESNAEVSPEPSPPGWLFWLFCPVVTRRLGRYVARARLTVTRDSLAESSAFTEVESEWSSFSAIGTSAVRLPAPIGTPAKSGPARSLAARRSHPGAQLSKCQAADAPKLDSKANDTV